MSAIPLRRQLVLGLAFLRLLPGCRLCLTVVFAVFVSILAIETVILVPSYFRQERELLAQIEREGLAGIQTLTSLDAQGGAIVDMLRRSEQVRVSKILGAAIYAPGGGLLGIYGTAPVLGYAPSIAGPPDPASRLLRGDGVLDVLWTPEALGGQVYVVGRLDTAEIGWRLGNFVARVAGLVLVIAVFTTAGTTLLLGRLVLEPVLRLRERALRAAERPTDAEDCQIEDHRRDEIGDLTRAFNHQLRRIADDIRANQRREAAERLRLERQDTLTGLPNRAYFLQHLAEQAVPDDGSARQVGVFLVGLDHFRAINDAHGHATGDQVLQEVGGRMRLVTTGRDFLARIGGDEFALIAPLASGTSTLVIAHRLRRCLDQPIAIDGTEVAVGASIGITTSPADGCEATQLLGNATAALAEAKAEGRGRVRFFNSELNQRVRRQRAVERGLRRAIGAGELSLVYQPKFDVAMRRPVGAEALVRWTHRDLGAVSPAEFIPIAEQTGQILPIGTWVLEVACAQARRWAEAGLRPLPIAVNLSAEQFRDPNLVATIGRALDRSGISPEALELEVTETAAMADVLATANTLAEFERLGVKLSIDDFGTGYSSLNYLRRFRVHAVKIDRSFIADIGRDPEAVTIARMIIGLGHSLGLTVIAEGVETEEQLAVLATHGCDVAQGFLLGRPMPADAMAGLFGGS
ncbi:MAG: EAL domain-containing protein [Azospirillum sp.]|nr:EAL domain-containing protein [Azospirillum sp.]